MIASPTLTIVEDEPASLLTGGEVPVEMGTVNYLNFGYETSIKVHPLADDKFRVDLHLIDPRLDDSAVGNVLLHESGVRCVKDVKLGETFTIDLNNGVRVEARIDSEVAK